MLLLLVSIFSIMLICFLILNLLLQLRISASQKKLMGGKEIFLSAMKMEELITLLLDLTMFLMIFVLFKDEWN